MIYIIAGNDTKNKNTFLNKITAGHEVVRVPEASISKELLSNYSENVSLFGDAPIVIVENLINESNVELSPSDIKMLHASQNTFVFLESKLLASDQKKYKNFAEIEIFEEKAVKKMPKINTFAIADSFARRDKVSTWMLYREAIEGNIEPEAISGMLFWKIKMMALNGTKTFSNDELKKLSSNIVSIYHRAHRGELDFVIGLEQFILSSLSK